MKEGEGMRRSLLFALIIFIFWVSWRVALAERDPLARGFITPPNSAKPHTWWHWMNGNISREGITRDLEEMKRVGLAGAQIFNVSLAPPGPIKFMSPEWRQMVLHAVREAHRLGLELCIHNCAGWSSSGGPWVQPSQAMQMITWSERRIRGPRPFPIVLPQPLTKLGFYRDIAVLAFRTPSAEAHWAEVLSAKVTSGTGVVHPGPLFDGDVGTFLSLPSSGPDNRPFLQFEFPQPFKARSVTLIPGPRRSPSGELQVSDDGRNFRTIASFSIPETRPEATEWFVLFNFEPVTARFYRFRFSPPSGGAKDMTLAELDLHNGFRIENLLGKAGFVRQSFPNRSITAQAPEGTVLSRRDILDLTARRDRQGVLNWEVPPGDWTILRIGYTPTGKTNHPAPAEGLGLECDKMSREAVKAYFDAFIGRIARDLGPLAGKVLRNVLVDSYEVGSQNWTPRFREEFRKRRGYDLFTWLPVLTGRVVESLEASERFLWDFRRTIADLFADNYYGYFAELSHRYGMLFSTEAYGNGPFDTLTCAGRADIPMSEFWSGSGGELGRGKDASSAGHTYGRRIIGAESFTAGGESWQYDPYSVKALGDHAYCLGVNRFIFHTYAHQPYLDRKPGMTLGPFGLHMNRNNTWWRQSRAWLKYLSRCQYLLQQGRFVADLCYFYGEGSPAEFPTNPLALQPPPPPGYDYDGCDAEILYRMSVKKGRIVLPSGMSYRVLILPDSDVMTPRLLRKIRDLVQAGAVVLGPKPVKSPSLSDFPKGDEEVKRLAQEVWGPCDGKKVTEHPFGKGKVYWGRPLTEVLTSLKIPPDFQVTSGRGARILYIHRALKDAEVYFLSNQRDRFEAIEATFRVQGRVPELWHPDTGRIETTPLFVVKRGRTTVPLRLDPYGSVFVVFRKPSRSVNPVVAIRREGKPLEKRETPRKLVILRAVYGLLEDPQRTVDVTSQVSRMVENNSLSVLASNHLAGDPAPYIVKKLRVDYTLDGFPGTKIVNEGEVLDIPEGGVAAYPSAEVKGKAGGVLELRVWEAGRYEIQRARGRQRFVRVLSVLPPLEIRGLWEVRFPPRWGAPAKVVLDRLISWTEHQDPGVRYFSGTAEYLKEIEIPPERVGPNQRLFLDLGRVKHFAEVWVNGRHLGILWKPPFRIDITKVVRPGRNRFQIQVTNLWINRLIGDAQLPPEKRLTWTTYNPYRPQSPLVESGLLGPVTLRSAKVVEVNLGSSR